MSNLIESMINGNVQFSKGKELKKSGKRAVKESVGKKTYHISGIKWDIGDEDIGYALGINPISFFDPDYYERIEEKREEIEDSLPSEFDLSIEVDPTDTRDDIEEKLSDAISDEYGWLISSFDYDEVTNESCKGKKVVKEDTTGDAILTHLIELDKLGINIKDLYDSFLEAGLVEPSDYFMNAENNKVTDPLDESKKRKKIKESVDKGNEVYIVVENGMVQDVFASPSLDIDVTIIDLDTDDADRRDEIEDQYNELTNRIMSNDLKVV